MPYRRLCVVLLALAAGRAQTPPLQKPDPLNEFSASLEALAHRVNGSVVQIISTGYSLSEEGESGNAALLNRQRSTGTGVVLSEDGYIVTNNHVVEGGRRIEVRMPARHPGSDSDGGHEWSRSRELEARVVGVDRNTDLAVLKVPATGLAHLALGDSASLRQGQLVLAFGTPMGLRNSVSMGVVSSVARQLKPDDAMVYIQTDAPINPGNSGGPLVDAGGRVMGINTFILSQSGGSEGLGFAIPSNIVRNVYNQIRKNGHVHRGQVGVYAQSVTPQLREGLDLRQDWGVLVGDVLPDGPADHAGLKVGDVIVSMDGRPLANSREFQLALYRHPVGDKLKLHALRGNDPYDFSVTIAEQEGDPLRFADLVDPEKNLVAKLGILGVGIDKKLSAMLPDLRLSYGVIVAARASVSPYMGTALNAGDVIHAVNGNMVTSVEVLRKALDSVTAGAPVVLQLERSGRLMFVTLEME
ncbi:MAG: trypsin-like peptidase domain-containing protein [Acidobacteria bacterium]|nr:trypsin-like peptidase domain-containing protein [Acidobacteriota bacterium]